MMNIMKMKGILMLLCCSILYFSTAISAPLEENKDLKYEPSRSFSRRRLAGDKNHDAPDDSLIQDLQDIPADKLKSLLSLINKKEDGDQEGRETHEKFLQVKDDPRNDEISSHRVDGPKSLDGDHVKLFRKLDAEDTPLKGVRIYHANGDSHEHERESDKLPDHKDSTRIAGNSNDIEHESESDNDRTTNVLIHAFEDGSENDKNEDNHILSHLKGMAKEENIAKDTGELSRKIVDKDEQLNRIDLFVNAEEKSESASSQQSGSKSTSSETQNDDSRTNSASNRMNLIRLNSQTHDSTDRYDQDGLKMDSFGELALHRDASKPINLKRISDGKTRPLHFHKINEKLPTKIIEEINNAMIQNVKESGDKSASLQDGGQNQQVQSLENNVIPLNETADLDASKRCRPQLAFSYNPESPIGPEMWKVLHTDWTCQGRKQSPINIRTDRVANDTVSKNIVIHVEPEGRPISGILRNNGHAPTLSLSNSATVRLMGGTLPSEFFLKQLHFHFGCESARGSEHKIDGEAYPLELHLVFWDKKAFKTFAEAAKSDRGIAVVAVLFQRSAIAPMEGKSTPLCQLLQVVKKIPKEGDFVQITDFFDFRLEKLIPNAMNTQQASRFFTYEGSLTTPGCYESVTWIVYDSHPIVTEEQLELFRKLKSSKVNSDGTMCDNFRPIQKSYGRRIYSNII